MTTSDPQNPECGQWWKSLAGEPNPIDLKIEQPHGARMYDYYLGGKDNFPADREAAEQALQAFPNAVITARQNRAFMARVIRFLAGEAGVRQFLDIGTGIPTSPNLHEIAQAIAPQARVVYADNDPIVLTQARALLTSAPEGRTTYLDADLREVDQIPGSPELRATLDLSQPVALSLIAVLPFFPDSDDPQGIVRRLVDALPSGSYLTITHSTPDFDPAFQRLAAIYQERGIPGKVRTRAEVEDFFTGLELVDPGIELVHRWRPDGTAPGDLTDAQVSLYGGLGRKP